MRIGPDVDGRFNATQKALRGHHSPRCLPRGVPHCLGPGAPHSKECDNYYDMNNSGARAPMEKAPHVNT
eukprot:1292370-Amphidinium_carterae.2